MRDGRLPAQQQCLDCGRFRYAAGRTDWLFVAVVTLNVLHLQGANRMTIERYIRIVAGSFVLGSLVLAYRVSPWWLWFTAFVGANLLQSGITNWCLMENILRKFGVGSPRCYR